VRLIESILAALFPPQAEPVGELTPGRRATVIGRVVPRDVIDGPLTGEPCVWYRSTVREWRRSVIDAGGFWVTIEDDEAIAEFYVQDQSGRAIVHPVQAVVDLGRLARGERVSLEALHREAMESRLEVGDVVEVSGMVDKVEDLLDEARGYRESTGRVLLRAPDGGVLTIRLVARSST
jgi:hypothetical protein